MAAPDSRRSDVEPAADGVEHPPQAGAVFGVAVEVGLQGAVPVGPAAQRPFGVAVPPALLGSLAAALTLATSSLSSGSELRLALSISSAALAGSAATPSDTAVACSAKARRPGRRRPLRAGRPGAGRSPGPVWPRPGSCRPDRPAVGRRAVAGLLPGVPSAERAAASALIDAADASIWAHNPTTSPACAARQGPGVEAARRRRPSIVEQREALGTWRVVQLVEGCARPALRRRSRPTTSHRTSVRSYPKGRRKPRCFQHRAQQFRPVLLFM